MSNKKLNTSLTKASFQNPGNNTKNDKYVDLDKTPTTQPPASNTISGKNNENRSR